MIGWHLILDEQVEFSHVEVFTVAKTPCAIALVTIKTEKAVLIASHHCGAPQALHCLVASIRTDHSLACLKLGALFESINAFLFATQSEAFLRSPESHKVLSKIVNHIEVVGLQSLNVDISETLMTCKFSSVIVSLTNLALHDNFWTLSLYVLEQLRSSHMLKVLMVADIASKLGALVNSMLLELNHSFPNNDFSAIFPALVRKLTEINAVPENLINWLQKVASFLAVGTAHIVSWSDVPSLNSLLLAVHACCILLSLCWRHLSQFFFRNFVQLRVSVVILVVGTIHTKQLLLAVFAEQLVALDTFHWLKRKIQTHNALNFFYHLALQLVGNKWHLDVQTWNRLRPHNLLDSLI